ncbi:PQQ-binding-like beta-propeller repeat protein [Flavobacterium sp. ALJ2]|uniref:PQQ-binding-like beta-propeller repeat protein n=1 Tax=Flavobacterium sp. ALJ2 TaxID=2786960 RepID=UPI0018A0416B|nr:PQQ-binding-like beta-propeller repeat protein [Flavobacterium sp. ALJ2]MBF7089964.1 PQQ-binding-like beta-propeller repeat protein [Flavobacterium sp. ALJ2]
MYSYKKKVITSCKDSSCFTTYDNKHSYIANQKIIVEENGISVFELPFSSLNSIKLSKNKLLIFDDNNNLIIYNTIDYSFIDLELDINLKIKNWQDFNQNFWILLKEKSIFENILGILNLNDNTWFIKDQFYPDIVLNNKFIFGGTYFKQICRYSIENGDLVWQTDISKIGKHIPFLEKEEELGEVKQFLGIWNNQLIVLLTGGKFISIDTESGAVLWEQNQVQLNKTFQIIDYAFSDPYNCFLDEEKGLVYILQGEVFIILDLKNQQASYEWNIKDKPIDKYLFIRQSRIFKNQIYFTAFRKENEGNDDTIGVFDIDKKEIIWQYTIEFEKANFIPNTQDNLQVNETNLYVLDSIGSLHIFGKNS